MSSTESQIGSTFEVNKKHPFFPFAFLETCVKKRMKVTL